LLTGLSGIRIKVYTYKELKIASDNFSLANKIGEGGFGSVYKVTKQFSSISFITSIIYFDKYIFLS